MSGEKARLKGSIHNLEYSLSLNFEVNTNGVAVIIILIPYWHLNYSNTVVDDTGSMCVTNLFLLALSSSTFFFFTDGDD